MSERLKKTVNNTGRAKRTRAHVRATSDRPRLSVHVSNMHVSAQIIDDQKGTTIASATSVGMKNAGTMTEKAQKVGESIAKTASTKKVVAVAFDRGSKKYHGRVKALADAARKNGLEF